jgi:hypothetical protein
MLDAVAVITLPDIDLIGIAAIVTALGVLYLLGRGINRTFRRTNQFFDDWYGTPGDSVHPPVPGVLKRMSLLEDAVVANQETNERLETKLDFAVSELKTNGGSTVKDAINAIALQQEEEVKERKAWAEQYDRDQRTTRAEWVQVFYAVRRMITMEPHEQLALWDTMTDEYEHGSIVKIDPNEDEG